MSLVAECVNRCRKWFLLKFKLSLIFCQRKNDSVSIDGEQSHTLLLHTVWSCGCVCVILFLYCLHALLCILTSCMETLSFFSLTETAVIFNRMINDNNLNLDCYCDNLVYIFRKMESVPVLFHSSEC